MVAVHWTVPSVALSDAVPAPTAQYSPKRVPTVGVSACVPSETTAVPVRAIGDQRRPGDPSRSTSTSPPTGTWAILPLSAAVSVASAVGYGNVSERQSRGVGVGLLPLASEEAPHPPAAGARASIIATTGRRRLISPAVRGAAGTSAATRRPARRSSHRTRSPPPGRG